jgi:hypothetical protein
MRSAGEYFSAPFNLTVISGKFRRQNRTSPQQDLRDMKIIESNRAPNPRRVRIFLAEKGIDIAFEQIDLGKLDHKRPDFCEFNPMKQVPVLILDDGTAIAETVAICRYFEADQCNHELLV